MIKRIFRNWYRYILWALLSAIFWAWLIMLSADAVPAKKVVLLADLPELENNGLEIALEKDKPDGIRFVETGRFENVIFDATQVLHGDLYLIPDSDTEEYLASFSEIDRTLFPGQTFYESDGKAYGILLYDEAQGLSLGGTYIRYIPGERCWLFFNKDSLHIGAWNGSKDDAAIKVAQNLLQLKKEGAQ